LGLLLVAAPGAYARTEITRLFSWPEKTEANIKAHGERAATLKKVSIKEYEELVGKELAAKVSGQRCGRRQLHAASFREPLDQHRDA
jgi:hypothetical protein